MTPETLAWIGLILGVSARVAVPYLRKLWAGEITTFDIYYLWQGIAGFILSLIVTVLLAPNMLINASASSMQLILSNFVVGFGATSIINEIFALGQTSPSTSPPPQKTT